MTISCGDESHDAEHNQEGGEVRAGSFVQPVDENTILHFFASAPAKVVGEEVERVAMIAINGLGEEDEQEEKRSHFTTCSTFEGIPKCLGSRLSRRMPGDDDYFQIDIRDLYLAAAADARLTEILALLRSCRSMSKTILRRQQVLERLRPSGTDVIAIAQPTHLGIGLVRAPQLDGISADASDKDGEKVIAASPTAASGDFPGGNPLLGVFHASLMPYLRYSCANSGSNLDRHYAHVQSRLFREDHYRIFIAKRLLSAATTVHYLRAAMFIVGLAQFLFQAMPLFKQTVLPYNFGEDYHSDPLNLVIGRESTYRGRRVRFTTLAVRDSNISRITSPGLSSFGVMLNGCRLGNGTAFSVSKSFSSIIVEFSDVVPFNGWFLITEQGDAALDPSIFAIDTLDDDLNWRRVTSSLRADKCGHNIRTTAVPEMHKEINALSPKQEDRLEVTSERGALMKFDFRSYHCLLPVHLIYISRLCNGLVWMTAVLISIYVTDVDKWSVTNLGRRKTHAIDQALRLPIQFACTCFLILSIVRIIGLILLNFNDSHLTPYVLIETPEMLLFESIRNILIWPVPNLFSERLTLELFGLSGLLTLVVFFSLGGFSWDGPVVFILACWLYWVREGRRHQQITAVSEDRVMFMELWERIMSTEPPQAVSNLRSFRIPDFTLADMNEKRLGKFKELLHCNGRVGEHQVTHMREEEMRTELLSDIPVMSLDQLYVQALVMQPFFWRKVQEIARQCNAYFHVSPSSHDLPQNRCSVIMPWADIECDSAALARVRWDELKHVDRAMYNLAIFHAGDVSKLTDVVRQRIVFQSLSDIHACLKCIAQNEEIEVVSIANGYDPQSDAAKIAGFREVVVSLRIISKSTVFFCLTRFVCELQLCHFEFDCHLTPARHSRQLRYKDTMYLVHPWKMSWHFTQGQGRNSFSGLESFSVSNQSPLRSRRDSSSFRAFARNVSGSIGDVIGRRLSSCRVANSGYVGGNQSLPPFDVQEGHSGNDRWAVTRQDAPAHCPQSPGLSRNRTLTANYQLNALSSLLLGDNSDSQLRVPVVTADSESELSQLVVERVFQVLRFRCEYPGGMLQARIKQWNEAIKGADTTMVMFTRPIGAFTKWPLQIIMCAAAAYMFYTFGFMMIQGTRPGDNPYDPFNGLGMGRNIYRLRHARFTVLETRVPQKLETGKRVGISSLDLLLDGCNIMNSGKYLTGNSTREYISFPETITADGWMITSSLENQSRPRDPRRFHLHFSLPSSPNRTLADCLLQNDWLSDRDQVSALSNAQQRMIAIRELRQRGDQWCKGQTCERMRDEDLAMTCTPPSLLGEEEWISVSASVCHFATSYQFTCIPRPLDAAGYEIGFGRGVTSIFVLSAPWYFVAGNSLPYLMLGMGFMFAVVFGLCGYIKPTYVTMSLVFMAPGLTELVCGFCFLCDPSVHKGAEDSFFFLLHGLSQFLVGFMLMIADDYLMALPPIFWVINLVALYINNQVIVKDIPIEIPSGASFFMAAWIFFCVHRQYLLWRSNKSIESDKRAYQALWDTIISEPDGPREISDIQTAVDCLGEDIVAGLQTASFWGKCSCSSSVHPWERAVQVTPKDEIENEVWPFIPGHRQLEAATVMSIDQLYMQAVILEPIFQDKIKGLAAASNGQFQTKLSQNVNLKAWTSLFFQNFVTCYTFWGNNDISIPKDSTQKDPSGPSGHGGRRGGSSMDGGETYYPLIHFVQAKDWNCDIETRLKNVDRAIEKIVRSYKNNISFVCDVVRQIVVFDSMNDMVSMLRAMKADPHIKIMRIKNRMSSGYNSSATFGYRDVLVNMCFENDITTRLGLNRHVCELQLTLKEFVVLRSLDGHKRYVAFRNTRCE